MLSVADHVHLLVSLNATHCLSDFMRELKRSSSKWIAERSRNRDFKWQEGYAAFTVSASSRDKVRDYIARQEEHHRQEDSRDELAKFLRKCGVTFDERYFE
jgi:REP element-mobilizing transposase RayT